MTPYSVLFSALYLFSFRFRGLQGSEHHVSTVFLLKGKDLFMELKTPKPTSLFSWRFKTKINIIIHKPNQINENFYDKRAMFSSENYSVQIKDVGLNDSGLYQAVDSGAEDKVIAAYHVTVQEQVSPVVLNASSESHKSCQVTVTCSTQSSSLNSTFTCTPRTCSEDGGDPAEIVTSDVPLHLYLSNGLTAICNHSNKVSWSNDTMEIKPLCFGIQQNTHDNNKLIIISSCLGVFMAILGGILGALYKRRKKNKRQINSRGSDDKSPNGDQSLTLYSMLGPSSIPLEPIPPQAASPESI